MIELSEVTHYHHDGTGKRRVVTGTRPLLLSPEHIVSVYSIDVGCRIMVSTGASYEIHEDFNVVKGILRGYFE